MAKPAFIKMTRIVAMNSQRLLARNAAFNSGSSAALADRLKTPKPKRATGTQASQVREWVEESPRTLPSKSCGASSRVASRRDRGRGRGKGWEVIKKANSQQTGYRHNKSVHGDGGRLFLLIQKQSLIGHH